MAIQQGWRVVAVVPRGTITVYVQGKAAKAAPEEEGEYIDGHWQLKEP